MAKDDRSIPKGRIRRTAQVGSVIGSQGARYAGTRAANLTRSDERGAEEIDRRHVEAAERMVDTLGTMKGAAMKIGQLASFIDTEFLPPEYRELYQDKLSKLRSEAPPMPWKKVSAVLEEEWEAPAEELFDDFSEEAAAAASSEKSSNSSSAGASHSSSSTALTFFQGIGGASLRSLESLSW